MSAPIIRRAPVPLSLRDPGFESLAKPFVEAGILREGAARLIDLIAPRFAEVNPAVLVALALVVEAEGRGHGALHLSRAEALLPPPERQGDPGASTALLAAPSPHSASGDAPIDDDEPSSGEPPTPPWARVLGAPVATSALVGPWDGATTPFVLLDATPGPLLLTRRFADEQARIARALVTLARAPAPPPIFDSSARAAALARFYPREPESQGAQALGACLDHPLAIITGGPGTGKTFTVLRVLAALLSAAPSLRVALAAPTGKAAVRMREAMAEDFERLAKETALAPSITEALRRLQPSTVHKLLRIRPDSGATRYRPGNPLPFDLVIIDEASMLDFTLMRKVVEAIGDTTRLVLLGDRDQLASVEAGTVLADIVDGALQEAPGPLAQRVVFFEKSYRFRESPLVASFARRVQSQRGDVEGSPSHRQRLQQAAALLQAAAPALAQSIVHEALSAPGAANGPPNAAASLCAALRFSPLPDRQRLDKDTTERLAAPYLDGYVRLLTTCGANDADARAALDAFDQYRILCTHRGGRRGVSGLNLVLSQAVRREVEAQWSAAWPARRLPQRRTFWLGLPVLVTENSYDVGLFNGDIGIVLPGQHGGVEVVFPRDGKTVQRVRVERIPPWMPAFALTVHKSQGSQFTDVAVILAERRSPIETRELLYTGVTRAKKTVHLVGCAAGIEAALARPVGRVSALRTFLDRAQSV